MHFSLKHFLHSFGGVLCLTGVVFVVMRLNTYAHNVDFSHFDLTVWSVIGLLSLVYGAANLFLARAWWNLLVFFGAKNDWIWAVKTYGMSQLAKYVPGNIFHLAGRQALGMAAGLRARPLAKSAVWELGLIIVAGTLFSLLVVPLAWPELSQWMSSALFVVISVVLLVTLHRLLAPSVGAALIWQIVFLAVSGAVFIGILAVTLNEARAVPALPVLCGSYVIAWLAGLVTPGAPAGVGVREMVLLFLLGGQIAEADLLLAVVLGRGVTVVGDFLFFAAASAMKGIKE